jgi:hypothetical protein
MMELDESSTMAGGDVAGAAAAVAPEANESLEQTLREAVRSVLSNNKELIKRLTK